jgi:hypothetical protein
MRYTHSHLGIVPRQPLERGNGLYAKRDANVDVDPPTFALSQPVVRAITVTAIGTTASQRRRQRGAHGVDVGFTESPCTPWRFCGGTSLPATFSLDFQLALRCARSIAAHTLIIAVPLLAAWPDLIVSGLPNETAHCQSPPSSRTTVYSMPRYSIDRPIVLNAAKALIADS